MCYHTHTCTLHVHTLSLILITVTIVTIASQNLFLFHSLLLIPWSCSIFRAISGKHYLPGLGAACGGTAVLAVCTSGAGSSGRATVGGMQNTLKINVAIIIHARTWNSPFPANLCGQCFFVDHVTAESCNDLLHSW